MLIDKLSNLVKSNDLSQAEFESIAYKMSAQESRLFLYLAEHQGSPDTINLRINCSIGNISDAASRLNYKLKTAGDTRKVICLMKPNVNQFDEDGRIGEWLIVDGAANE